MWWSFQSGKKQKQCMHKIDKTYTFDFYVLIIPILEAKIVNKENIIKQMISLAEKKRMYSEKENEKEV